MNLPIKIAVATAIEVSYAVFTRTWLSDQLSGVELEIAVSVARVLSAIAYWLLFKELVKSRAVSRGNVSIPVVAIGIAVALSVPFLFRGWSPGGGLGTATVFALTSVIVGFREELLYRAVLLNLLQPRVGSLGAIAISTVIFVVYHTGAQPMTPLWITECVSLSVLLAVIYLQTGSLLVVVAFHTAYDAIWFFEPILSSPLPDSLRPVFLVTGAIVVIVGARPWKETRQVAAGDA